MFQNLFAFGDIDGTQFSAKLQHPLGVAFNARENSVYVTDTYNHKIKKIDVATSTLTTCKINDTAGNLKQFNEPADVCLNPAGTKLYVADTNNHLVEIVDLATMASTSLKLKTERAEKQQRYENDANGALIRYPNTIKIKPQGGVIHLHVILVNGVETTFTKDAPQKWQIHLPNSSWTAAELNGCVMPTEQFQLTVNVPGIENSQAEETVRLSYRLMLCANDICFPKVFTINFTVAYSNEGLENITEILQPVITRDSVVFL